MVNCLNPGVSVICFGVIVRVRVVFSLTTTLHLTLKMTTAQVVEQQSF